ncbi:MAG: cytochrome c [Planctomycetes bacterium]|nr:cytochrome c [Planctomycetota bacterium]
MPRRRAFLFWYVLAFLALAYVLLERGLPRLASALVGVSPERAPLPGVLLLWYMLLAALGAALQVSMSDGHWRDFTRPLRSTWVAGALILLLSVAAALETFRALAPAPASPTVLRLQHPPMPAEYESLASPYRNAPTAERDARLEEGRVLYQVNCRPCHGAKADGRGPMHRAFSLRPANFRAEDTIVQLVEPAAFWRVQKGGPGLPPSATPWDSAMPSWEKDLTPDETWKLLLAEYDLAGKHPRQMGGKE